MNVDLDLHMLLTRLANAECEFVVIGSSALAMQGWKVRPADLDVMAPETAVDPIIGALAVSAPAWDWVEEGEARRLELRTPMGLVDIYVKVSGGLAFEAVQRDSIPISLEGEDLSVSVGSLQHVRDMRAAVGRSGLPQGAVPPAVGAEVPHVVAIDGPAGAGKSTVSKAVADELGLVYLNTGAMYRCVALAVLQRQTDTDDVDAIAKIANTIEIDFEDGSVFLDGRDVSQEIRQEQVTKVSAHIAAYPEVRIAMIGRQRRLFEIGGYIVEGRDTGTVVVPRAPLKIYLTASLQERARRRSAETGEAVPTSQVMEALANRDDLDSQRELGALREADDAVVVDTTDRSFEDVVDEIAALARERGIA